MNRWDHLFVYCPFHKRMTVFKNDLLRNVYWCVMCGHPEKTSTALLTDELAHQGVRESDVVSFYIIK